MKSIWSSEGIIFDIPRSLYFINIRGWKNKKVLDDSFESLDETKEEEPTYWICFDFWTQLGEKNMKRLGKILVKGFSPPSSLERLFVLSCLETICYVVLTFLPLRDSLEIAEISPTISMAKRWSPNKDLDVVDIYTNRKPVPIIKQQIEVENKSAIENALRHLPSPKLEATKFRSQ